MLASTVAAAPLPHPRAVAAPPMRDDSFRRLCFARPQRPSVPACKGLGASDQRPAGGHRDSDQGWRAIKGPSSLGHCAHRRPFRCIPLHRHSTCLCRHHRRRRQQLSGRFRPGGCRGCLLVRRHGRRRRRPSPGSTQHSTAAAGNSKVQRPGDTPEGRRSTLPAWARRRALRGRCCRHGWRPTCRTLRWGHGGAGRGRARRRPPTLAEIRRRRRRRTCMGRLRGCGPRPSLERATCCVGRFRRSYLHRCRRRSSFHRRFLRRCRRSSSFARARPRRGCGGRRPQRRSSRRRTAGPKALNLPGLNSEAGEATTAAARAAVEAVALDNGRGDFRPAAAAQTGPSRVCQWPTTRLHRESLSPQHPVHVASVARLLKGCLFLIVFPIGATLKGLLVSYFGVA